MAAFALTLAATASAQSDAVTNEYSVAAKMRDGVTLFADIYRPRPICAVPWSTVVSGTASTSE